MKLYFLKEDALETLRGNVKSNLKNYAKPSNEWIYEFFENQEPFGEYKYEVNKFDLLISRDKPEETDIENIKILYTNLKMLTDSQATDERLWAGMAHSNFWEYMNHRWKLSADKLNEKEIKSKFFFNNGRIRSLIVHPIAKLWWAGRNTYDETRKNPFELTEFLERDFATRNFYLFSSNFSKNEKILRALLSAMIEIENDGAIISRSVFLETTRFINILGGTYILDYFEEEELKEKVKDKIKKLLALS